MLPRLSPTLKSSHLHLRHAGVTGMRFHARPAGICFLQEKREQRNGTQETQDVHKASLTSNDTECHLVMYRILGDDN